jgi:hypothetical protein
MEDMWEIKKVLEVQGNRHNKVEVQANSKSMSPISSPTRSPGQIEVHMRPTSDLGDLHMHGKIKR